jgi:SAM-dependent methyltransferase
MWTIETFFPNWRSALIHESSPESRGASIRLSRECPHYIGTQFFPDTPTGTMVNGVRCENLEALTFDDDSIDLHVTQDVFEHVFDPETAFSEIARTLRPGGAHVFTVPLVEKEKETQKCAALVNGQIVHFRELEYHSNPISAEGSLVTMRWGYDICNIIAKTTGLFTQIIYIDALELGIRAECIEVLLTRKPTS